MATTLARLTCDEPTARRLATFFDERLGDDVAVAAFENDDRQWAVEITFSTSPDQNAIRELVASGGIDPAGLRFSELSEKDWVAASLADLTPVRAGRFLVHGAHHRGRFPANLIGIEIEAALAFGTGHHGTTRGCLLALDRWLKSARHTPIPPPARGRVASAASRVGVTHGAPPGRALSRASTLPLRGRDKKILDVGTGTGVLAIAAAKVLHSAILTTDIDPVAVRVANANARHNGVAAFITNRVADGRRGLPRFGSWHEPFDVILANILLGPLMRMAPQLTRRLAPGGTIVLSGLLPEQANAAVAAYRNQGLALVHRAILENWVTLVMRRGSK